MATATNRKPRIVKDTVGHVDPNAALLAKLNEIVEQARLSKAFDVTAALLDFIGDAPMHVKDVKDFIASKGKAIDAGLATAMLQTLPVGKSNYEKAKKAGESLKAELGKTVGSNATMIANAIRRQFVVTGDIATAIKVESGAIRGKSNGPAKLGEAALKRMIGIETAEGMRTNIAAYIATIADEKAAKKLRDAVATLVGHKF